MMASPKTLAKGVWTSSEHERFLEAIALYPHGPWTLITEHVGTRSAKQVQTHAQKYQHKLMRHERGLLKRKTKSSRVEHRVDKSTADVLTKGFISRPVNRLLYLAEGHHQAGMPHDGSGSFPISSRTDRSATSPAPSSCSSQSDYSDSDTVHDFDGEEGLDALLQGIEPVPFTGPTPHSLEAGESNSWNALDFLLVSGIMSRSMENEVL